LKIFIDGAGCDGRSADEDVFYAYGISLDLISDVTSAGLIRVASPSSLSRGMHP